MTFCWFPVGSANQRSKKRVVQLTDTSLTRFPVLPGFLIGQPEKNIMKRCQQFMKDTFIKERNTKLQFL